MVELKDVKTGWWLGHPSEKYEFVNWDDEIPNIWENKKWQPNHQPVKNLEDHSSFAGSSWIILCWFWRNTSKHPREHLFCKIYIWMTGRDRP